MSQQAYIKPFVPKGTEADRLKQFHKRKRINKIAITLSLFAMAFGVFWLLWILWETVRLGVGGLTATLFTESTPAPNDVGCLANALYGPLDRKSGV